MAGLVGKDGERYIWVLDPVTRKLRVPVSLLVPTQATTIPGTVPSLCLAFLEGRCRHPWCRQAHVAPSAITQLRHEALNAPTCCQLHGDPHDTSILTDRFDTVTISDSPHVAPIPNDRVALTVGLQRYLAHSVPSELRGGNLELPLKLICRLHQSQRCRYMEDCNNIHLCRELDLRLMPPPHLLAPLTSIQPGTQVITIGEHVFSVTMLAQGEIGDDEFNRLCDAHNPKSAMHRSSHSAPGAAAAAASSMSGEDDRGAQNASPTVQQQQQQHQGQHQGQQPSQQQGNVNNASDIATGPSLASRSPAQQGDSSSVSPLPGGSPALGALRGPSLQAWGGDDGGRDVPAMSASATSFNGNWSTNTPPLAPKASGYPGPPTSSGSFRQGLATPLSHPLSAGGGGSAGAPPPPYGAPMRGCSPPPYNHAMCGVGAGAPGTPVFGPHRGASGSPAPSNGSCMGHNGAFAALRVYDVRRTAATSVKC